MALFCSPDWLDFLNLDVVDYICDDDCFSLCNLSLGPLPENPPSRPVFFQEEAPMEIAEVARSPQKEEEEEEDSILDGSWDGDSEDDTPMYLMKEILKRSPLNVSICAPKILFGSPMDLDGIADDEVSIDLNDAPVHVRAGKAPRPHVRAGKAPRPHFRFNLQKSESREEFICWGMCQKCQKFKRNLPRKKQICQNCRETVICID